MQYQHGAAGEEKPPDGIAVMTTGLRCIKISPTTVREAVDNTLRPPYERRKRRWLLIAQLGLSVRTGVSADVFKHDGGVDGHGHHSGRSAGEYDSLQSPRGSLDVQSFLSNEATRAQSSGILSCVSD